MPITGGGAWGSDRGSIGYASLPSSPMTSAHLPTDSSSHALQSLRERLERATRARVADQGAGLALAHLGPGAARGWLEAHADAARNWPAEAVARLLALLTELAI